jgi:alpha-tubulin suppressor-like RCC1 family protein
MPRHSSPLVIPSRPEREAPGQPFSLLRCLAFLSLLIVAGGCGEDLPTSSELGSSLAPTTKTFALAIYQVSSGRTHTCALTTDQRAYCWGSNFRGMLGIGTDGGYAGTPMPVVGVRQYRQISAGEFHTCAVATDFRAYCWGDNWIGQLGDGSSTTAAAPVRVAGGLRFRQIEMGYAFTCGVTYSDQRVYCWGYNHVGQLGDGTMTSRPTPAPVLSAKKFRHVSAGQYHACGVTTSDEAYCWGWDRDGQVGNDLLRGRRTKPVRVAGGLQFRQVDAGESHTCGVTTTNRVYCWGNNEDGQLGNREPVDRLTPAAVTGNLRFSRVSAGRFHTCGETTTNLAYCWGRDAEGQLGDGGASESFRPVLVAGGLNWTQLSAGGHHTCGKTPSSVAYCWGVNNFGVLGQETIGIGSVSRTPVPVSGVQ